MTDTNKGRGGVRLYGNCDSIIYENSLPWNFYQKNLPTKFVVKEVYVP